MHDEDELTEWSMYVHASPYDGEKPTNDWLVWNPANHDTYLSFISQQPILTYSWYETYVLPWGFRQEPLDNVDWRDGNIMYRSANDYGFGYWFTHAYPDNYPYQSPTYSTDWWWDAWSQQGAHGYWLS